MPLVLASTSHDANSIINDTTAFQRLRQSNGVQQDFFGHVMPLVLGSVSHDVNSVINGTLHSIGQDDQNDGAT